MKEVKYISFCELEREYFEEYNTWKIEEEILYSFSEKEMKNLIYVTNQAYLKLFIPYRHILMKKQSNAWYEELSAIEQCLIDLTEYYFYWWEELEKTKNFLERIRKFYKVNYESSWNFQNFKKFDVNSVSIVEVLSNYIKIPKNLNRNICCPLHKEKSWSFRIYKNTNSFYCFGCHKWWNSVNFVSEIENITNKEAYIKLAKLYSNYWNHG